MNEDLAAALLKVIGEDLLRSGLGHIWRDARTWRGMADELVAALKGKVVLIETKKYNELVADAKQFHLIRAYIEDYKSKLPKDKREAGERRQNPYARWAAENANGEKKE
jgi:hypothetical protein